MEMQVNFYVYSYRNEPSNIKYPAVLLENDNWDDFGHKTLYRLTIKLSIDEIFDIGAIKIFNVDDEIKGGRTKLDSEFKSLDKAKCISIGQSIRFYRRLKNVDLKCKGILVSILTAINDACYDVKLIDKVKGFDGWEKSLLRESGAVMALERAGIYFGRKIKSKNTPKFTAIVNI
ncbi:hypothetical protein L4D21_26060, partial [Photobacterium profundum]|uniref:hypothetical protein n=1 Tax=Photobacterium profundum TaxID=74109 RepID=UPI003D1510AC